MKWWYWLILELLIIFGVIAWIYFFPSDFECDFAKGMIGFVLIYTIEDCKDIRRMKTMDYKEGMTCGECLKYEFCPIANHNTNHKACMKITTKENYTIEQNAGENQIEGDVVSIGGSIAKHSRPFNDSNELIKHFQKKYKSAVGCDIYFPSLYKPAVWVREKDTERDSLITEYAPYGVTLGGEINRIGLQELFDNFTFLDGSPIGKLEEE